MKKCNCVTVQTVEDPLEIGKETWERRLDPSCQGHQAAIFDLRGRLKVVSIYLTVSYLSLGKPESIPIGVYVTAGCNEF